MKSFVKSNLFLESSKKVLLNYSKSEFKMEESSKFKIRNLFTQNELNQSNPIQNEHRTLFKKPNLSYIALISQAIHSKPDLKMTLKEIYQFISDKYPYYRFNQFRWQNSVRHNLSLNRCFERLPGEHQKGKLITSYWTIRSNWELDNFKRRVKKPKHSDHSKDKQLIFQNQSNKKSNGQLDDRFDENSSNDQLFSELMICQTCKLNKQNLILNRPENSLVKKCPNSVKFKIENLIDQ